MKYLITVIFCAFVLTVNAQTLYKNEAGFALEGNSGAGSDYHFGSFGLQGQHWIRKDFAWRFTLANGQSYLQGLETFRHGTSPDTVDSRRPDYFLSTVYVSASAIWQRHFSTKVSFYLGAVFGAGIGSGYYDTIYVRTTFPYPNEYDELTYNRRSDETSGYLANLSAILGLRIDLKRFVIGTEFTNYLQYVNREEANGRTANVSFSSGNISQKFYVNYKF